MQIIFGTCQAPAIQVPEVCGALLVLHAEHKSLARILLQYGAPTDIPKVSLSLS